MKKASGNAIERYWWLAGTEGFAPLRVLFGGGSIVQRQGPKGFLEYLGGVGGFLSRFFRLSHLFGRLRPLAKRQSLGFQIATPIKVLKFVDVLVTLVHRR